MHALYGILKVYMICLHTLNIIYFQGVMHYGS